MPRLRYAISTVILSLLALEPATADEVRVLHYGGVFGQAMKEAFFEPAAKEMNTPVIDQSRTDMAKIKASVESGKPEWDVVNVNTLEVGRGAREGLWEKIDWSVIDPKVVGPVGPLDYGVAFIGFSIGLTYSTKEYPDPMKAPQNWADFWDVKKFPGPRALENRVRYQLEFALLADGVPRDKLYPLDVDRAFRKLDQIKPYIVTWARPPVQPLELLMRGEVVMAPVLSDVVFDAVKKGGAIAPVWNEALYLTNSWSIVKGSPNVKKATEFIKTVVQPAYEARLAELTGYGPMNPEALALVKPETRKWLPTEKEHLAKEVQFDNEYWAKNEAALIERWTRWLAEK
jgi:putative spermidine/putrescine transport system substrate-binding protein